MQFLDITGLNYYTGKLKDGTLKVGAATAADSVPASGITGTIDISHMPATVVERLSIVATEEARLALTTATVQNGDSVKVTENGKMYFVKDDTKLGTADAADAFEEYTVGTAAQANYATTAGTANSVDWDNVADKPSTFAPSAHVHSSAEVTTMASYELQTAASSAIATTDTLNQAISKLEKGVNEAKSATTTAIEGLDATVSQTAGTDGLALSITEADGVITSISGSIAANTYEPYGAASTAIAALDATVSQSAGADGLALQVVETDGVLTSVSGSIAANTYDAYGAAATAKSDVIGANTDASSASTIYGAKAYADAKKSEVIGASTDASTANTVYGAKAYADAAVANIQNIGTSTIDAIIAGTYSAS